MYVTAPLRLASFPTRRSSDLYRRRKAVRFGSPSAEARLHFMPILETDGLTRRFGTLTAVDALTMTVESGEVFGLLGRSEERRVGKEGRDGWPLGVDETKMGDQ